MKFRFFIVGICILFLFCDKELSIISPVFREESLVGDESVANPKVVDYPVVPEDHPAQISMRKKANQMARICWTPMN